MKCWPGRRRSGPHSCKTLLSSQSICTLTRAQAKSGLGGWVSLEEVLQDDQGVQALYRFLSSEFCEENLLFIKRVQAFKGADSAAGVCEFRP